MELLALAGPAEAGIAAELSVMWLGVMATFAASLVGLVVKWRTAAGFGAVVWLLTTVLFSPWQEFFPEPSADPDVLSFQMAFRKLTAWWATAGMVSAVSMVRAFWPMGNRITQSER